MKKSCLTLHSCRHTLAAVAVVTIVRASSQPAHIAPGTRRPHPKFLATPHLWICPRGPGDFGSYRSTVPYPVERHVAKGQKDVLT